MASLATGYLSVRSPCEPRKREANGCVVLGLGMFEVAMNRIIVAALLLTFMCRAWSAEAGGCIQTPDSVCLTMQQFQASTTALKQYQRDQPHADLSHFLITVSENEESFEVSIFPTPNPATTVQKGNMMEMTLPNPHGNQYGLSAVYVIDKKSQKIIRSYSPK